MNVRKLLYFDCIRVKYVLRTNTDVSIKKFIVRRFNKQKAIDWRRRLNL